ncbi:MAG: host attachment protein [Gammaproteobacteria bacterium]|nr:host attachment protein [Gammaproteobacteria bacterium]
MSIAVIVADASRARVLFTEDDYGKAALVETEDLVHPESRLREQDLVTDGTGSGTDSGGFGMHSMGHEKAAHDRQAEIFAVELCARIDKIHRREKLRRIYLVAPPRFLGMLRASLSKQCVSIVAGEVSKNLVASSLDDIREHLPKRL